LKETLTGLLAVGRIVKAHGTRGDVAVQSLSDVPGRFKNLQSAYLGVSAGSARHVTIDRAVAGPRGVRLHIAGVGDRTAASQLAGQYLFVDAGQHIRLPKGRHFVHEVIGLTVIDQEGVVRGTVKDVMKLPAHDVYLVGDGAHEFMIPAVKEFVIDLDVETRRLTVKLIDGMLEGG
jgi:16S rRNA processing protein RimM